MLKVLIHYLNEELAHFFEAERGDREVRHYNELVALRERMVAAGATPQWTQHAGTSWHGKMGDKMRTFYNLGRELSSNLPESLYDALAILDKHMNEVLRLAYQGAVSEEDLKDRAAVIEALEKIDRALARS